MAIMTNRQFKIYPKKGFALTMEFEDTMVIIYLKPGSSYTPHNVYRDKSEPIVLDGTRPFDWKSYRLSNIILENIHEEEGLY